MGGSSIKYPEPSVEERSLSQNQAEILMLQRQQIQQEMRQLELLAPILYGQAGIRPQYEIKEDGTVGAISGFTTDPAYDAYQQAAREAGLTQVQVQNELLQRQIPHLDQEADFQRSLQPYALDNAALQNRSAEQLIEYQDQLNPINLRIAGAQVPMAQQQLAMQQRALEAQLGIAEGQFSMEQEDFAAHRVNQPGQIENQGLALQRLEAALRGELPVDPGLMTRLESEEALMHEALRKDVGPGYMSSTPFFEANKKFQTYKSNTIEQARRADIAMMPQVQGSLLEAPYRMNQSAPTAGVNQTSASSPTVIGGINVPGFSGIPQVQGAGGGVPSGFTGVGQLQQGGPQFGNISSGFAQAMQPFAADRAGQFSANQANAARDMQEQQFMIGTGAAALGTTASIVGALAAAGVFSSITLKDEVTPKNEDEAMEQLRGMPTVDYRYKGEEGPARHSGTIAELAPRGMVSGDGMKINLADYVGTMHAGVKHMDRRLQTLEDAVRNRRR